MNEKILHNIFLVLVSFILYYLGILHIITKLFLKKGLYIFNYHSFNTFTNDYYRFGSLLEPNYQKRFERQIKFYLKNFRKASLSDENISVDFNKKSFLVTFDDGYRDNYTIALPIIRKFAVPTFFFVATNALEENSLLWHDKVRFFFEQKEKKKAKSPGKIKKECKQKLLELKSLEKEMFEKEMEVISKSIGKNIRLMMNWDEIKECYNNGNNIAPHTHSHTILSQLKKEQQEEEIFKSIKAISTVLNTPDSVHFCIPDGKLSSIDNVTMDILFRYGIKNIYLTESGINTGEINCLDIKIYKRIGINPSDPIPVVMLKVIKANLK